MDRREAALVNAFDTNFVLWLNGLSGNVQVIDDLLKVLSSDYLMPLLFSTAVVAIWFAGRTHLERSRYQVASLVGMSSIGFSNLAVFGINSVWDRPRPYVALGDEINLLFYRATDPSFPANPVAIGFAAAAALWPISRATRRHGLRLDRWPTGFRGVYAGVFYPTDIFGGAAVGVLVVLGTLKLRGPVGTRGQPFHTGRTRSVPGVIAGDSVYLRTEIRRNLSAYSNGKPSAFARLRSLILFSVSEPCRSPGIWLLCWDRASSCTSIPPEVSTMVFCESAPQNRRWLTLCGSRPSRMCSGKCRWSRGIGIDRVHDGDSDAAMVTVIES